MGSLLLVRHAQASALAANYDRLSPLGEEQARRLGEAWAEGAARFDRLYSGPRERQRRTAELALEAWRAAGGAGAELVPLDDLDEMRIEPLLGAGLPAICREHDGLRPLGAAVEEAASRGERLRAVGRLGVEVIRMWSEGRLEAAGAETWSDFSGRIGRAIDAMLADARCGARLGAFTSAGSIGAAAQLALQLERGRTVDLLFRLRNASLSEFLFSGTRAGRFSLASFNEVPHLQGRPELHTLV